LYRKIDANNSLVLSELVERYCKSRPKLSDGTLEKYNGFKNILGDFDVPLYKIDPDFINDLYKHFLTRMNINSAYKRMHQLDSFLKFGIQEDMIRINPMMHMKFKKVKKDIIYLNEQELHAIENKNLHHRIARIRDVFIFQCYTGMEYSRLHTFETKIDIKTKRIWIDSIRNKTKKKAVLPMFPKALEIWERYDRQLPIKSNSRMNAYLKEIQDICGIEKTLHTHLARHTFATTICLLNGVSEGTTAEMMGITIPMLIKTYGKITRRKIDKETSFFFDEKIESDTNIGDADAC